MKLVYQPLLQQQRELFRIPRGPERFRQYLREMLNEAGDDLRLPPLVIMNPMGREHVAALIDELLALDADGVALQAITEIAPRLSDSTSEFQVALVVADDLKGEWTNRYSSEYGLRFGRSPSRYSWITVVLWTSEPASTPTVREGVLTSIARTAYIERHGPAHTLREMMAQEGHAMLTAGCIQPALDADDLAYSREVIDPHLDAQDSRTAIECLYGDAAARSLGFTPRGLSAHAGLALALHEAQSSLTIRSS